MTEYLIVIEQGETSYGAYSPYLPGCVAVGETLEEVERLMREGIALHIEGLQAEGAAAPQAALGGHGQTAGLPGNTEGPARDISCPPSCPRAMAMNVLPTPTGPITITL